MSDNHEPTPRAKRLWLIINLVVLLPIVLVVAWAFLRSCGQ